MTPRRALVSGASSGIGRATVRALVGDGWEVVATARRSDRLETLADETGCEVFTADLTRDEDVAALAEFAGSTGLDAVVNVAGGARGVDRIDEADTERWKRMFDINVMATLKLTSACLPLLRRNGGGSLVFVTSTAAHGTYP